MRGITKLILSVVLVLFATAILMVIRGGLGTTYSTGGIGPFIVYPALLAGLIAIWKYNPKKANESTADKQDLKKD